MSLRYALLALLRAGPMSGYDLQKVFSVSVGHVWHAHDSQIYPELRKMANDGLIEPEEQRRGELGRRKLYHITPSGERAFAEWMNSPLEYQRVRDPAHLRASYLEYAEPAAVRAFLRGHIDQWQGELALWEAEIERIDELRNPMLARRLESAGPADREATIAYKRFTYEGLVDRARAEIAWAQRGLELADRLDAGRATAGRATDDGAPRGQPVA